MNGYTQSKKTAFSLSINERASVVDMNPLSYAEYLETLTAYVISCGLAGIIQNAASLRELEADGVSEGVHIFAVLRPQGAKKMYSLKDVAESIMDKYRALPEGNEMRQKYPTLEEDYAYLLDAEKKERFFW